MAEKLTYVICCTDGKAPSLHACRYDEADARLTPLIATELGVECSFYAVTDPSRRCLYVVDHCQQCQGVEGGAVSAYRIDASDGRLTLINTAPAGGQCPCYIAMSDNGRYVLTACYVSGSVSCLPVNGDGSVGSATSVIHEVPEGHEVSHAHSIILSPDNRFALAADLGIDRILTYRFDGEGEGLIAAESDHVCTAKGAGPRHVTFHPNGRRVYCQTEYDNTMIAFDYDAASGGLTLLDARTTLPDGYAETTYGADVHIHPNGRFIYGSNRGHDSIAVFAIDDVTGHLEARGQTSTGGQFPRGFIIDPAGRHLLVANQNTDDIAAFAIDEDSGALTPKGKIASMVKPCGFVFV